MWRLKVNNNGTIYIKKFPTLEEVFAEMKKVLFGSSTVEKSMLDVQNAAIAQDIRFYVSYKRGE